MLLLLVLFLVLVKNLLWVLSFHFLPIHSGEVRVLLHDFGIGVVPISTPEGKFIVLSLICIDAGYLFNDLLRYWYFSKIVSCDHACSV